MIFDNNEKDMEQWLKREKHIRFVLTMVIIVVVLLIIIIVLYGAQIWAIITGVAVIVGLIADLMDIMRKGKK